MDKKSFVLGVAAGVVASTVVYLLLGSPVRVPDRSTSSTSPQRERSVAEAAPEARVEGRAAQHSIPGDSESSRPDDPNSASPEQASDGAPDSWPPPRASLMQEAKDPGWSHYMEQTLRQYLAGHPKASQFDFTSIDCRQTFCEVVALGFDRSTVPVWNQVIYDLQQQPWNAFDMTGSEVREQRGRPLLSTRLHRASSTGR